MKNKKRNLNVDERFWQLLTLADEGDECAQAELWHVYEFTYGVDEAPVTNDRLIQAVFTATPQNKSRALAILQGRELAPQPEPLDEPLLLKMGQAASLMGLSRATLWRLFKEGRLEKVELYPGSYRVRKADVHALINERGVRNG